RMQAEPDRNGWKPQRMQLLVQRWQCTENGTYAVKRCACLLFRGSFTPYQQSAITGHIVEHRAVCRSVVHDVVHAEVTPLRELVERQAARLARIPEYVGNQDGTPASLAGDLM